MLLFILNILTEKKYRKFIESTLIKQNKLLNFLYNTFFCHLLQYLNTLFIEKFVAKKIHNLEFYYVLVSK
ncbi:hypothetical protein A0H76_963 [Hepatospora eriocheir]|uniref:Uncharacterized protein n=1 Tax=Hepatospora eriocheir TaxID=1081669 RepID=A0A1X0Q6G3_9MICR|nr:hypothetical protein A0H76_963 [Hepatospora eriocheir]